MMGALARRIAGKVQVRLTTRAVVVATAIGLAAGGCADPGPAAAAAVVVTTPAPRAPDERLPVPAADPVLTITGRVERTNVGHALQLDEDGLDALGRIRIELYEPWVKQRMSFQGVWLADVLAAVGVDGGATGLHLTALTTTRSTSRSPTSARAGCCSPPGTATAVPSRSPRAARSASCSPTASRPGPTRTSGSGASRPST